MATTRPNIEKVKPSQLKKHLEVALLTLAEENPLVIMVWGEPGLGKSAIVRQVAEDNGLEFRSVIGSLMEPSDLMGIPSVENGVTSWNPPAFFPRESSSRGIMFLDEATTCRPDVQAAMLGLVYGRKLGEYRLPDGWLIVMAGNGYADRAMVNKFSSATNNRVTHAELIPDVDDWCRWAVPNGVAPEVIAWVRFRPGLLHRFDADANPHAWPSCRSNHQLSTVLKHTPDEPGEGGNRATLRSLICATIGEGPGSEFMGFLDVWKALPRFDRIVHDPVGTPTPDPSRADVCWATASMCSRLATVENLSAVWAYVKRFPSREFQVVWGRDLVARSPELAETPAYIDWAVQHQDAHVGYGG